MRSRAGKRPGKSHLLQEGLGIAVHMKKAFSQTDTNLQQMVQRWCTWVAN